MRRFVLVSYDITNDKRRLKVYKTLNNWGDRIQYSVFCCQLNRREKVQLIHTLKKLIHHTEDQILFTDAGRVKGQKPQPKFLFLGKHFEVEPRVQIV